MIGITRHPFVRSATSPSCRHPHPIRRFGACRPSVLPAVVLALSVTAAVVAPPAIQSAAAEEPVDLGMVTRIREEGLHRSQVMDILHHLTDVIGPRLTGSPNMREANDWTRDQLEEWGLAHAHLEGYDFGRGWSFSHASVHLIEPKQVPLSALPEAWTPGTGGPIRGEVIHAKMEKEEDFEQWKGKLDGKIVFLDDPSKVEPEEKGLFRRYDEDGLTQLSEFPIPGGRGGEFRQRFRKRFLFRRKLNEFLRAEHALATVHVSSRQDGVLRVGSGGSRRIDAPVPVCGLVMAAEHYNRILRLLEDDVAVALEIDVAARFHDDDLEAYNTVAEIPGRDRKGEVVMVGAHMDSWHAGTGATDNGAGCAVALEAVRILQALDVHPRRTIRIALWSGEEQGLLGSRAYVAEHFATRPQAEDAEARGLPSFLLKPRWPITTKPEHAKLCAYFNLDNGSGKIRGIYAEENAALVPVFEAWLRPFEDLGATTVTLRRTRGTDHMSFDAVGLPGFQFIQDGLDYSSRTHHTDLDVYDHAQTDDLKQASVVMASFLYHAAMRPQKLPRKPMPTEPPASEEKKREEKPETPLARGM